MPLSTYQKFELNQPTPPCETNPIQLDLFYAHEQTLKVLNQEKNLDDEDAHILFHTILESVNYFLRIRGKNKAEMLAALRNVSIALEKYSRKKKTQIKHAIFFGFFNKSSLSFPRKQGSFGRSPPSRR